MVLPDDSPSTVNLYAQWLYSKSIPSRNSPGQDYNDSIAEHSLLIKAFIFGEKIQDGHFKDALIDALIHAVDTPDQNGELLYPEAWMVECVYQGTPEGCPFRRLLVDMHVFGESEWLNDEKNVDFLRDLGKRLIDVRKSTVHLDPTRPSASSCQYHHHGTDNGCYSARPAKSARRD